MQEQRIKLLEQQLVILKEELQKPRSKNFKKNKEMNKDSKESLDCF